MRFWVVVAMVAAALVSAFVWRLRSRGWPSLTTIDRITVQDVGGERSDGFEKSYIGMRLVIGLIGLALPLSLVLVDAVLLKQSISFRGSMSAYYHSSARDLFVGGLSASGVTLISYMLWRWWTWDFIISSLAGVGVLSVAAFPTARPRDPAALEKHLSCTYSYPRVPPCTQLQEDLGEDFTRTLHICASTTVVIAFTALCLVFALREFGYGQAAHDLKDSAPVGLGPVRMWEKLRSEPLSVAGIVAFAWASAPRTILYLLCMLGVSAGGVWALTGPNWHWLWPHTYAGEYVAFTSFGIAWLVASWDLLNGAPWLNALVQTVGASLGVESMAE